MRRLLFVLASCLAIPGAPSFADSKRVLVFGDSNSWGWRPVAEGFPATRLPDGERWPGVMAALLGPDFAVVVDGLSGRTVDVDYPQPVGTLSGAALNGARALPEAIARELPLDLVIIMLGTNDARSDLQRTPAQIAAGIGGLVSLVRHSAGGVFTSYKAPSVLIVTPPAIGDTSRTPINGVMAGAAEKSRALAAAYDVIGQQQGVPVFDAARIVTVHGVDGVHLTAEDHAALGQALATEVRRQLGEPAVSTAKK